MVKNWKPQEANRLRNVVDEMTTKARDMIVAALLSEATLHAERANKLVHGPAIMKHKELDMEFRELASIIDNVPHIFFIWEEQ